MASLDMFGGGFIQYLIEQEKPRRMIGTPMNFAWHRPSLPGPTDLEKEVLEMCAGIRSWPQKPQAWVNASIEFLQEDGYVTRGLKLTEKGRKALE